MDLGERTGISRELTADDRPNSALPLGLDVANVTTADPGVQVENVSARGRRTRYQRVPGSVCWGSDGKNRHHVGPPTHRFLPGGRPPLPPMSAFCGRVRESARACFSWLLGLVFGLL